MKKILVIILLIALGFGVYTYQKIFGSNVTKNATIYIKSNSFFDDLLKELEPNIKDINTFKKVAKLKKFDKPKAGKFTLKKGMSLNDVINKLRLKGETVKVIFNNQDRLENLAGRIAQQLEVDSLTLLKTMKDSNFLQKNGFTEKSALAMYIPNQYEFYWTDSAEKFRSKMLNYYNNFWNENRKAKAKKLNLSPQQVITLASIVQKETSQVSERPIVAGLYLNRYKNNWALQADPTIIFALKEKNGHDKIYKRVLNKDLEIDSPYNTYKNIGLPPTLIAMPDISSIEAVLNPQKHDYFFMCASTEKFGFHNFARTLEQHNRNAQKYRRWISKQGIKR